MLVPILSLFKSTEPYLWTLRLIAHVFNKNSQQLCSYIFDESFYGFFAENIVKLFVENVKEGPSRKVMECLQNKQNVSQIWHRGFKLAAAAMQAIL